MNISVIKSRSIPLSPIFIALSIYIGSIVFLFRLPFLYSIDSSIVMLSIIDYLLTIGILTVFLLVNRRKIIVIDFMFRKNYLQFVERFFYILCILVIYSIYVTYLNLSLVFLGGYNREGLLNSVNAGYLDMLLPNLFNCLFVVSLLYKYPLKVKLLLLIGTLSVMLFYLSRSNLLFLVYFPIVFLFIFPERINFKTLIKFTLVVILVVSTASYITILQGRGENLLGVLSKITETLFRYKAYSFYLSEYAIDASVGVEKSVFPFFGFLSEKLLSLVSYVDNPISIYNSEFVFEFRFLGNGYRANVLYPWWSWFYGYYGVAGLIIKAVYVYIILSVILYFRMSLLFMYFLYLLLFVVTVKHPFINAAAFYSVVVLIVFDSLVKLRGFRVCREKNSHN